jgi:NAD(P)-dependent dehydrogenase (short-subunit alcohol dehydrogenase family)
VPIALHDLRRDRVRGEAQPGAYRRFNGRIEMRKDTDSARQFADRHGLARPDEPLAAAGHLDGLVNAAGMTDRASMLDGTVELWNRMFSVNTRAPYFLMQSLIRHLRETGRPGSIVNIQSVNAHCGATDLAVYSASKGALSVLTRNAAHAHLADRIRVNGINMGWCATPAEDRLQAQTLGKGPGWQAEAAAALPLGRLLTMQEVANLTLYLLSDLSGLQTGTVTDLEGRVIGAPA